MGTDDKPPGQPPPLDPVRQEAIGPTADKQKRSTKGIVGFILAFIVPPLGALISIKARREIKRKSLRGKGLSTFGIVWGIIFTPLFLLFVLLFILFNGWASLVHGNVAQKASKPFVAKVMQAGGKQLCDNGDDGYGIDNTTPWYQAYYQIASGGGLTNEIKGFAKQEGYSLHTDTANINQLKENSYEGLGDQEQFNPKSDYLTGRNGGDTLEVTINRDASVPLYCNHGKWGRKQSTGNDTAILDIDFTAPDTNR